MKNKQCMLKNNSILPCENVYDIMEKLVKMTPKQPYNPLEIAKNLKSISDLGKLARDDSYKITREHKNNLIKHELLLEDGRLDNFVKDVAHSAISFKSGGFIIDDPVVETLGDID